MIHPLATQASRPLSTTHLMDQRRTHSRPFRGQASAPPKPIEQETPRATNRPNLPPSRSTPPPLSPTNSHYVVQQETSDSPTTSFVAPLFTLGVLSTSAFFVSYWISPDSVSELTHFIANQLSNGYSKLEQLSTLALETLGIR